MYLSVSNLPIMNFNTFSKSLFSNKYSSLNKMKLNRNLANNGGGKSD